MKPLILCLGNEVLSDDRFGVEIETELKRQSDLTASADVVFAPVAGFYLLDLLAGRRKVLIVDTIRTGAEPGALQQFSADHFAPTKNLISSHQISLPTALDLGKRLDVDMPETVDILAVEAEDLETLREELTPAVRAALPAALEMIRDWVFQNREEKVHDVRPKGPCSSI